MKQKKYLLYSLFEVITALMLVYSADILKQMQLSIEMKFTIFLVNFAIVLCIECFWYGIIGNVLLAIIFSVILVDAFAIVNYFVMVFRGKPIYASDIQSIGTAVDVVHGYRWSVPKMIIVICIIHLLWLFFVTLCCHYIKTRERKVHQIRIRVINISLSIVVLGVITFSGILETIGISAQFFSGDKNGLLLNFLLSVDASIYKKPDGYSEHKINEILSVYKSDKKSVEKKDLPNIVVIMNESFSDLSIWGDIETNQDYLKFYHEFNENVLKGWALSSVWGGNTANSEFEFLTGNSMYFYPNGSVPYQTYLNSEKSSLVSYLESFGYHTVGIHPGHSDAWNRENVYQYFGFDETCFLEDREWDTMRNYVSDQSCYDYIKEVFANNRKDEPLFVFNVTIQNHGGYLDENYENKIKLTKSENRYPATEQYLSLIQESDKALENLIDYLEGIDQEVIVLFFGDHQPKLEDEFVKEIIGDVPSKLDQKDYDKLHYVPYFIWSNRELNVTAEKYTSINYLSNLLLSVAGIPFSNYNKFLNDEQKYIPILSMTDVEFSSDNNEVKEKWINQNELLSYFYLFDKESSILWK